MILDDGGNKAAGLCESNVHENNLLSPEIPPQKNDKPAGACRASGPKSDLFSGSLCTPQRARHVAVMMMVRAGVEVAIHAKYKSTGIWRRCQRGGQARKKGGRPISSESLTPQDVSDSQTNKSKASNQEELWS